MEGVVLSALRTVRWIKALALILVLLAVAPMVVAQGEDEIIIIILGPLNNNFANAEDLVLNSTHKTTGSLWWSGNEAPEDTDPDLTVCSMKRTVWYKLVAPFSGRIALSTQGSYIVRDDDEYTQDTKIAVYTGSTLANLSQVACNDDNSGLLGEIPSLSITQGTTYYVRVGLFAGLDPHVSNGYYKLTSVILDAFDYSPANLSNGTFGIPSNSIFFGWKLKNNFNGDGTLANEFKFIGGLFESTKLVQKATWKSAELQARVNHLLELDVQVVTVGTPNFKIGLTVLYNDGTPASKSALKITSAYNGFADLGVFFTSPNVSKVKVVMKNGGAAGTSVTVDNVALDYDGGLFKTEAAPLALPLP
jgi:hypothetical protein